MVCNTVHCTVMVCNTVLVFSKNGNCTMYIAHVTFSVISLLLFSYSPTLGKHNCLELLFSLNKNFSRIVCDCYELDIKHSHQCRLLRFEILSNNNKTAVLSSKLTQGPAYVGLAVLMIQSHPSLVQGQGDTLV